MSTPARLGSSLTLAASRATRGAADRGIAQRAAPCVPVPSMLRVVVKLQGISSDQSLSVLVERARRRADRPPISGPRRRPADHPTIASVVHPQAHAPFGCEARVDARPRLLSELAPEARPPETFQSRAEQDGCGTFSVTVALGRTRHKPYAQHACTMRSALYAAFNTAPAGSTPAVAYRHRAIKSLRASATMPTRRARFPRPKRS